MSNPPLLPELNLNVGILGHVDAGKTSLVRVLSTELSTASLDKSPQSQERGMTLDLGFSSFLTSLPSQSPLTPHYSDVRFTFVDCPGHSSLIRTIIGGAQIIDIMVLVIDCTKGVQAQTAECLVLGEIIVHPSKLIVALNKCDTITDSNTINKIEKNLRATFKATKFTDSVPIVRVSAASGAIDALKRELFSQISNVNDLPVRMIESPLYIYIDHCFPLHGRGTAMTGTVIQGKLAVGDTIEIPAMKAQHKIKSLQVFHCSVTSVSAGDRCAIGFTGLDSSKIERGVVSAVSECTECARLVIRVKKIRFYKGDVSSHRSFHVSVGHETLVAQCLFFAAPICDADTASGSDSGGRVDLSQGFELLAKLSAIDSPSLLGSKTAEQSSESIRDTLALLTFSTPLYLSRHPATPVIVIGSDLTANYTGKACRLAFHGTIVQSLTDADSVRLYKLKSKMGFVDRFVLTPSLANSGDSKYVSEIIGKAMFASPEEIARFNHFIVSVAGVSARATINGAFGKSGKFRMRLTDTVLYDSSTMKEGATILLRFRQFVNDRDRDGRKVIEPMS